MLARQSKNSETTSRQQCHDGHLLLDEVAQKQLTLDHCLQVKRQEINFGSLLVSARHENPDTCHYKVSYILLPLTTYLCILAFSGLESVDQELKVCLFSTVYQNNLFKHTGTLFS